MITENWGEKSLTKNMTNISCISQVWKILNAIREKKILRQSMNKWTKYHK